MPLSTINNGASSATARASINAAITGLNNASGPNVIYVTKAGNDTTGDGSLAKPFLTLARAVTEAAGAACTFKLGHGTFAVSCTGWSVNQVIRGEGWESTIIEITSAGGVDLIAHDCDIDLEANGTPGINGANGTPEDINGQPGTPGSNAYSVVIKGTCRVLTVSAKGGVGGNGGNGGNFDDGGNGGNGGNSGNSGSISLKVPFAFNIQNGIVSGGNYGSGVGIGSPGITGNNGSSSVLEIDGCDFSLATVDAGVSTISRSFFPNGFTPSNDRGGNASL
jgi:hypothetical protein